VDIVGEKIATEMETEEVYMPSAFSRSDAKPKVSLVYRRILLCLFL
jgi:hypothetical protein